jgi:hypothetical protein
MSEGINVRRNLCKYLATTVKRETPHGIKTNIATGRHKQVGGSLLKSIVYQMS